MKMLALIDKIELCSVTRPEDMSRVDIKHRFLADGAYRNVYELTGFGAVIKFPKSRDKDEMMQSLAHARKEIMGYMKIRRSQEWLRDHLPDIYYEDLKSGIIIMKKYIPRRKCPDRKICKALMKFFGTPKEESDFEGSNLGTDPETGRVVVIDLGIY